MAFWIVFLVLLYLAAGFYLALDIDNESLIAKICVVLLWPGIIILFMAIFLIVAAYATIDELIKLIAQKRGG